MIEKPHKTPTGLGETLAEDSEVSVTETAASQAGAMRTFIADTGGADEARDTDATDSEQREMTGAGASAPF